jgi:TM2 domain-containing membrane protein YozV
MSVAPNLSPESRWLRLGGIALMLASMIGFAAFEDVFHPIEILRSGDASNVAWIALIALGAANALALGLVLLLAGLRELSLLRSAQARRGAMARMAGANLMLLCLAVAAGQDLGAFSDEVYSEWTILAMLVVFVLAARLSITLFRSGWKYEARTAEQALASDPRPPVLYLRSFGIDDQILVTSRGLGSRLAGLLTYTASVSPEQEMAFILERVGPVVAIGKPGERLPQLGAARVYVADDQWRAVVGKLMSDAALVVIRAGDTENLWWEVQETMTRCPRQRIVIVALGPPGTLASFERRFSETFGAPRRRALNPRSSALTMLLRVLLPYGRGVGQLIYFDRQGNPCAEPLSFRITWSGFVLSPYRPYRDALQAAFRNVFAELGIRWASRRSQAGAVLLALFGGLFGLHHFYVGKSRRGFWYLAFFWLALPMVLGWIDAMRLALLDDRQFRALVKAPSAPGEPLVSQAELNES